MRKTGRNDPCPCGSGKKFKQCCLLREEVSAETNKHFVNTTIPDAIQEALAHHQAGRLSEAEVIYRKILQIVPSHSDALHLLGLVAHQVGRNDIAVELIGKAISVNPCNPLYYLNLGAALASLGNPGEAVASLRKALSLQHDFAEAHNSLGNVLRELGQFDEAIASCRRALEINPDYAEANCNLGAALQELGQLDEAVANFNKALSIKPDFVEVLSNLGNAQRELGQLDNAVFTCLRALEINPDYAEAHSNLGATLQDSGQLADAVACYYRALEIKPDFAEAHNNLGNVLRDLNQLNGAVASCRRALAIKPDFASAYNNLGNALRDLGQRDEAMASYRRALEIKPGLAEVRWKLAMNIPLVAAIHKEIEECRADFICELAKLNAWFNSERIELGHKAVGSYQPFYLAYQEENNREFLFQYGILCVRLMKHWQDKQIFVSQNVASNGLVRVGIVSAHVHNHSVWNAIVKGWLMHLDRNRIELHVFHVGSRQDEETAWAKSRTASFEQGKRSLEQWAESILAKHADVLIYPEIGMDQMTVKLASLRLARVQIASWGHPETSGLPTIDYYLSAEYLEPPDAQNNYTEKLICLPNLGCHYLTEKVTSIAPDLASLGIDNSVPLFLCPGTPFKYAPQHDHVFVEIAQQLGKCRFVFFRNDVDQLTEKLFRRLELFFAKANMSISDYCIFIPWQDKASFYGLMKRADVFLDTIGFSGFNTAIQAVECGLPVVTREGRFLRGRLASGILRHMGMTEFIANTEDEYVNLAVRLAQDGEYRQGVRHRIEISRHVLFDDLLPVRALEDFLTKVVERG